MKINYKNIFLLGAMLLVASYNSTEAALPGNGSSKQKVVKSEGQFKLPSYEKFVLDNGLTVYLMEQHEVPLINVSAIVPAGAIKDGAKSGLASLTADALLFGTKSFTKKQIEETFDFHGASVETYASQEYAGVEASFMSEHKDKLFPILKEILVDPKFQEDEFKKKQSRLLVELDQYRESPSRVIGTYFNKFIFQDHVYGNPLSGTKATVGALKATDAKNFYQANYQPNGAAIAIVGDFNTKEMKARIQKLFKDWKKGTKPAEAVKIQQPVLAQKSRVLLVNKDNATETTFYIGGLGVQRNNPDYVGIQVVNTVLGGRFTSWLNDELRVNSGLTYGAGSRFNTLKTTGTFAVSTFTKNATTTEAVDLALQVLDRLHTKGIDKDALESAKNYVKGQFPPRYETSGQLADLLTNMYWYEFDESFINNFQKNVDELTPEKVREIVQKYFPKQNLQFVMIGKASEIRDKVKKYGDVTEKEITADEF